MEVSLVSKLLKMTPYTPYAVSVVASVCSNNRYPSAFYRIYVMHYTVRYITKIFIYQIKNLAAKNLTICE